MCLINGICVSRLDDIFQADGLRDLIQLAVSTSPTVVNISRPRFFDNSNIFSFQFWLALTLKITYNFECHRHNFYWGQWFVTLLP